MKKTILLLTLLVIVGCGEKQQSTSTKAPPKDPKIAAIDERVAKTTPEGKQVIEKVQALKPEVNDQPSGKTLAEVVEDYSKNKGPAYNITPLGWEASQKKSGRWKIAFNYQDWQKNILVAEWEYNPENNKIYPFEFENAKGFWIAPEPGTAKAKK
jgi:hypothetical protein